ncbi:GNAT family N-acetyltransferase [Amycolatopsis sp. CA-230715]|uniref:GNAT family N-acetyltransferase n=1 Tax=Amycolatopsis sp. CA-230715 TaxID=2745196 RepID=UPI001C022C10|nr:GNAT family N-acetyltransferase [Amycolatopsis sp. CA-230715]
MADTVIRPATDADLGAAASLRWAWVLEYGVTPLIERDEFIARFTDWARQNSSSHRCIVLARGDSVVGMAWLAITPRVPTPFALERASGDVQCVYITPGERDSGHGGALIETVLELAKELELERVTVHSTERAVSAYARHGFDHSPHLLQAKLGDG